MASWPARASSHGIAIDDPAARWGRWVVAVSTSVNLPFVRDVMFTNGVDVFTTTGAADPVIVGTPDWKFVDSSLKFSKGVAVPIGWQLAHHSSATAPT
jgi:hypothetical protein